MYFGYWKITYTAHIIKLLLSQSDREKKTDVYKYIFLSVYLFVVMLT